MIVLHAATGQLLINLVFRSAGNPAQLKYRAS